MKNRQVSFAKQIPVCFFMHIGEKERQKGKVVKNQKKLLTTFVSNGKLIAEC